MTSSTIGKPKRGRPKEGTENAVAVAVMEAEVVRLRVAGWSFPQINAHLEITNADRIFNRAAPKLRDQSREDAYALESARLDALHAKAWEALTEDGLEPLAHRVAEILHDRGDDWEGVPELVRSTIARAYADTHKGVATALGVHDRRAKLDGLTHSDRVADAQLSINQAQVQVWGALLVEALGVLDVDVDAKRRVLERMRELSAGQMNTPDA